VKHSEDRNLIFQIKNIRRARENPEHNIGIGLSNDRIALLDAIGFDWGKGKQPVITINGRIKQLDVYKEKHDDWSLAIFCSRYRRKRESRNNPDGHIYGKVTDDRIASLDALGFDWSLKVVRQIR